MSDLLLEVWSVADMDIERAAAVGRAFDADPELRPRRVGGDPARIRVDRPLEELIRQHGLPIDWLTVRTNAGIHAFEGGRIELYRGRGGFVGMPADDGEMRYSLRPHGVDVGLLRTWLDAGSDRPDRVAALFERLCAALDACYAIAMTLPRPRAMPRIDIGLGDVGWLNFFGPAFVERWPGLRTTPHPTAHLPNGGCLVRTAADPWSVDAGARQRVVDVVGDDAFQRDWGLGPGPGVRVPSMADHLRFSPGTSEMPWEAWLAEGAGAREESGRRRRYAAARRRRQQVQAGLEDQPLVARAAEWSASFDAGDWRTFGRRLFRALGGELTGRFGTALVAEIASAPPEHEESVGVRTRLGPVEVRWFKDDSQTVDLYLFGAAELPAAIDAVHAEWAERG